jgi:hypothetical protein
MRLGENVFEPLILLNDWYDTESKLQDKSWMHSLDWEEATVASGSNPNEGMLEPKWTRTILMRKKIHLQDIYMYYHPPFKE